MTQLLRFSIVPLLLLLLSARNAAAAPITWYAEGMLDAVFISRNQPPGNEEFALIAAGTPWSLTVVWDSEAPGRFLNNIGGRPTYEYRNALLGTVFSLGAFTYRNSGGQIYVNADLPFAGYSSSIGGPGLVQFHWDLIDWTGGVGGPNLNYLAGLLIAGYNDVNSVDGSLPDVTPARGVQGLMNHLVWYSSLGPAASGGTQFYDYGFAPQLVTDTTPVPVPEPGSLLLLGSGLAVLARRATRRR